MKKHFYIAVGIALLFSKITLAQDVSQTPVATSSAAEQPDSNFPLGVFGVRFMPTFSNIKVENADGVTEADLTFGYGAGGFFGINFSKHAGVQIEVIYNVLSQKYKDHNLDRMVNISYVNIPLLLSLNTNRNSFVNLNLVVGPQIGFNVGATLKTTGTSASNGTTSKQGVLAVKKNDFGFAYGAGLDFGLNSARTIRLDVGFRGVIGLIDVSDRDVVLETNSYYILKKDQIETYSGYAGLTFLF